MKRILSTLLAGSLVCSMLSVSAFGAQPARNARLTANTATSQTQTDDTAQMDPNKTALNPDGTPVTGNSPSTTPSTATQTTPSTVTQTTPSTVTQTTPSTATQTTPSTGETNDPADSGSAKSTDPTPTEPNTSGTQDPPAATTVDVSYNAGFGGVILINGAECSGSGSKDAVALGTNGEITIDARANEGYTLDYISVNNRQFAGGDYIPGSSTKVTVRAEFTQNTPDAANGSDSPVSATKSYQLQTASAYEHGKVEVRRGSDVLANGDTVNVGETLTITATPDSGYQLATLSLGGKSIPNGSSVTIGADFMGLDLPVLATFRADDAKKAYTVSFPKTENGYVVVTAPTGYTMSNGGKVEEGGEITVTAKPGKYYVVDTLTASDGVNTVDLLASGGKVTINANTTINATFKAAEYTVAYLATPQQGTTSAIAVLDKDGNPLMSGSKVPAGETVTIKATPEAGYGVSKYVVNNEEKDASGNEYAVTVEGNTTIAATFAAGASNSLGITNNENRAAANATVNITAGANGTTTVYKGNQSAIDTISNGASNVDLTGGITIVATPTPGYYLSSLKITPYDSTSVTAQAVYSYPGLVPTDAASLTLFIAADKLGDGKIDIETTFAQIPLTKAAVSVTAPSNGTLTATVNGVTNTSSIPNVDLKTYPLEIKAKPSSGYVLTKLEAKSAPGNVIRSETLSYTDIATDHTFTIPANTFPLDTTGVTVTATFEAISSLSGIVARAIDIQDDDGDPLEDAYGSGFGTGVLSNGRVTLDGIAPKQTFYIKLGTDAAPTTTYLSCGTHTALSNQLVNEDLFKLTVDKDGDGKSLVKSVEQIDGKNLDGARGSYLAIELKDYTGTEEKDVTLDLTFKAKKTLVAANGDKGTWDSGDYATMKIRLWITNEKISGTDGDADTGDSVYFDPDGNEYCTFIWGDDRAAIEFYSDDDADSFYARLSTKSDIDIYTDYGDPVNADLWFYNFIGNPKVPCTSRASLTLGIPWDSDDDYAPYPEDCYIYEVVDGDLVDVTDRFTYSEDEYEIEGWTIKTRVLGTYVVSDTELDLYNYDYELDYDDSYDDATEVEDLVKFNPSTGGGDAPGAGYTGGYYTPVLPSAVTGATADVDEEADADEDDDPKQMRVEAVTPTAPKAPVEKTDARPNAVLPILAIVLAAVAAAGTAAAGFLVYRKMFRR